MDKLEELRHSGVGSNIAAVGVKGRSQVIMRTHEVPKAWRQATDERKFRQELPTLINGG